MIKSMDVFHKCTRLIIQYNKMAICPISTSAMVSGKNKFTIPLRDIMLDSRRTREVVEKKRKLIGLPDPNKDKVNIFFDNRNPRHMELMGYNKPSGFTTLFENRNFYNKLHLDITHRHAKAYVENVNGHIICYSSTTEFAIAKRLHNSTDVSAVINVARVLAERLKKTGLLRVSWCARFDRTTEKIREFEGILINSGILLTEPATKVLQGPPKTLPPQRPKRVLPRRMTRAVKLKGTIMRKDKKGKFDSYM